MGSCYSGDHTTRDHINTDITICNTEEPQQTYRIGTVSSISGVCVGGGGSGGGDKGVGWERTLHFQQFLPV